MIIPQLSDGRLLLEKQYRHSINRSLYEFPAGHMDPGEDPRDAARRELEEETGYKALKISLLTRLCWSPGRSPQVFYFYHAAVSAKAKRHLDDTEVIKPVAFSEKELEKRVRRGAGIDGKTALGFLFYQKYVQKEK